MARQVYTYIIVGLGIILLLAMAGLDVAGEDFLNYLGIQSDFTIANITITPFYIAVAAIFAAAGVGGFVLGFLSNRSVESFIVGTFASAIFVIFMPIFWNIVQLAQTNEDWTGYLLFLILIPYLFGFAFALINYWRGSD